MTDWNALAEKHKLGTTDAERTLTLLCREMAKLVPQELPMPGEPDDRVPIKPVPEFKREEASHG